MKSPNSNLWAITLSWSSCKRILEFFCASFRYKHCEMHYGLSQPHRNTNSISLEFMYRIWTMVLLHVNHTAICVPIHIMKVPEGINKASSQRWLNCLSACINIYRTGKRTSRIRRDSVFGAFKDTSVLPDSHKNNEMWTCPGLRAIQTTCDAQHRQSRYSSSAPLTPRGY